MSIETIFTYIEKYKPLEGMDPQENYLTQIFAWLLKQNESFQYGFIKYLSKLYSNTVLNGLGQSLNVNTQVKVVCSDGSTGYIDMLIDNGETYLIFEHKVSSCLSDNQINKYITASDFVGKKVISVLIAFDRTQFEQEADISITWRDVHQFVSQEYLQANEDFMVRQFEQYLRESNMGCDEPFTRQEIIDLWGDEYSDKVTRLFRWIELELKRDSEVIKSLGQINSEYWKPGLFVGILIGDRDHGIKPVNKEMGPDFCVCLEMNQSDPNRARYVQSQEYRDMVDGLRNRLGNDYSFIEAGELNYRVLVIRKSFADVIRDCDNWNKQYENVANEVKRMIMILPQGRS